MREPYGEAVAPRTGPEPWRRGGDAVTQASAGERAGWVLSRETYSIRGVEAIPRSRRPWPEASPMPDASGPRAVVDPTHVRKLSVQELGGPASGRDKDLPAFRRQADGVAVRAVNPTGARRR